MADVDAAELSTNNELKIHVPINISLINATGQPRYVLNTIIYYYCQNASLFSTYRENLASAFQSISINRLERIPHLYHPRELLQSAPWETQISPADESRIPTTH